MPPSTFASAAAGNAGNANPARDGNSDWSRRTNGSTHTFRRTSTASSSMTPSTPQEAGTLSQPARYVPPHRNGSTADARYSREQLLHLYKAQQSVDGGLYESLPNLFIGGWEPESTNGSASGSWGRSDASRDVQPGPEICWDRDGSIEPLALTEMDDEERELFSTSVNTPLKPPATKESQQANGLPTRKTSISSQVNAGGQGPLSPTTTRGPGRRRDTSDSYSFPSNPLSSPPSGVARDAQRAPSPPPSLLRRRTDVNKPSDREGDTDEKPTSSPFGSLKRNPTGPLSAGLGAPLSPWSTAPSSAGLSPMGSFGNFGLGQPSSQSDKRPGLSSGRSESRFKNVLNKESSEDIGTRSIERKTSISSLTRVNENELWKPQHGDAPPDETDEDLPTGSAALDADAQYRSMQQRQGGPHGIGTPGRGQLHDDFGFGAFGMTSDNAHGFGHVQQTPAYHSGGNEPTSPADTNPYQSPEQRAIDHLGEDFDPEMPEMQNSQLPGLGGFGNEQAQHFGAFGGLGALPNLGRPNAQLAPSDRSQTSSVGANRGFPGLTGLPLGGVSGAAAWPVSQGGIGTPSRQTAGLSNPFGSNIFSAGPGDLQSPGLMGLGTLQSPHGGIGGSRMASMFPPAMQDQMRLGEPDDRGHQQPFPGLGGFGRAGESSIGSGESQGGFGDHDQLGQFAASGQLQPAIGQPAEQAPDQLRSQQPSAQSQIPSQQASSSSSSQPPPPQQRTMVMPDRMRWIYRDPQGQTQGPWSGLEMHDWYKAGFFSPELLVKKLEDPDYEPLAQLIRRIGNSREPFLVPQIGIPHGVASNNGPNAWAGSGSGPPPSGGGAQPPFASSFPSFGTTLTAEQQNALERRKQEEQYLMARQKEHLAQAQMAQRMQHHQVGPHGSLMPGQGQLHHHGSAQSLHSQPSFGSMTSPPYQASPNQAPQGQTPGFFDNSFRAPGQSGYGAVGATSENLGQIREEDIPGLMDQMNLSSRAQGQFGAPGQSFAGQQQMQSPPGAEQQERQVQQMLHDRARLQQEQDLHDLVQQPSENDQQAMAANERLQQFQHLQGQAPASIIDARFQAAIGKSEDQSGAAATLQEQIQSEEPSLAEQVQMAASAQQSPALNAAGLPQPFPPAPSQSPLPAPAAQRTGRQSVADQLQTEQRDLSETSSIDTPSAVAPWAKDTMETTKGPSLKEIQAIEAKKAAEAEEMASAARRAAFHKEIELQQAQAQAPAPAPGLPASASWGATAGTPTGGSAVWAKAAQKTAATPNAAKSMAQIQKEEEARKKRLAIAAANAQVIAQGGVAAPVIGKSYATLAGKVASPTGPTAATGAWTTVGASGKVKTPAATPTSAPQRAVSSGVVPTMQSTAAASRKPPTRSATMASPNTANAQEEFRKWAIGELRPDLNKGISAEEFVSSLVFLPPDADIITEAVHGASNTIDSRHFAEEFIRRKKLADKGLVDPTAPPKSASPHSAAADKTGGWSEVAKKGPAKAPEKAEESNGNFRVVAAKKKGGKR